MRQLSSLLCAWLFLAASMATSRADVLLTASSNISIREEGEFDTASGSLRGLLAAYLERALRREQLAGSGATIEIVVRSEAARWTELPATRVQDIRDVDSFQIEIGSEPRPRIIISGRTPLSAGYGVMAFLEEHVGIHWAFPGELGLGLPKPGPLRLREGIYRSRPFVASRALSGLVLRTSVSERTTSRGISGVFQEQRAFFQADDYFKTLRLGGSTVTHAMARIFPVERCEAECPEIFPKFADGRPFIPQAKERGAGAGKTAYQAWHPCYTEPKTLEMAIAAGRESFQRGQQFYSLGINDGRRFQCQCECCQRVGWPQSYYQFVTKVADALRDDYPLQKVGVLAYGDVGVPPRDLKLPENVLVNVAGQRKEIWESKAPSLGSYEYIYGAGFAIPNLPLEIMQENFRYYERHHLQLYRAELYPVWAFDAPKAYIIRHLLWDPNRDVRQLLREFCSRTFGAAGDAMFQYYLHAGSWRSDDVRAGIWTPMWGRVWPFQDAMQFQNISADYHQHLFAALADAKSQALTENERRRLEMVEHFTRFSQNCFQMWQLKEAVFAADVGAVSVQEIDRLAAISQELTAGFAKHPEWFLGSSVGPESFLQREWPLASLRDQLRSAAATVVAKDELDLSHATIPARARGQFTPLRKEEHPWYKPWQSRHMKPAGRVEGGFQFESVPNEVIQNAEDTRHNGKQRFQWLHANGRNLNAAGRYLLRTQFDGAAGLLELRVQGTLRRESRARISLAHSFIEFSEAPQNHTRQFVIDMSSCAPEDREPLAADELNLQWILLWRPDNPTARLSGSAFLVALPD